MTELDALFDQIGWKLARQDGDHLYYVSREAIEGFQPKVKIVAGDYELEEIVAIAVYESYLAGLQDARALAVKYIGTLL